MLMKVYEASTPNSIRFAPLLLKRWWKPLTHIVDHRLGSTIKRRTMYRHYFTMEFEVRSKHEDPSLIKPKQKRAELIEHMNLVKGWENTLKLVETVKDHDNEEYDEEKDDEEEDY